MSSFDAPIPPSSPGDSSWLANAVRSVRTAGTALYVFGLVSVGLSVLSLVLMLVSPRTVYGSYHDGLVKAQKDLPADQRQTVPPFEQWVKPWQLWGVITSIVGLAGSFIIVIGGMRMRNLSSFRWAVAGAVMAFLPFTNGCCCAGLPIGAWALVALFGADVRLAFTRIEEMGGLEHFDPNALPPSSYGGRIP